MLAPLGLGPAEEQIYRLLVTRRAARLPELASASGLTLDQTVVPHRQNTAEWSRAYPLRTDPAGDVAELHPEALDDIDRQVLALLLSGLTDQALASHPARAHPPPHG